MFMTKYKRAIDILDKEIDRLQYCYDQCANNNYKYGKVLKPHDELILRNQKLMEKYLIKLEALGDLKKEIQSEMGV